MSYRRISPDISIERANEYKKMEESGEFFEAVWEALVKIGEKPGFDLGEKFNAVKERRSKVKEKLTRLK